jgi:hypothetical protein
MIELFCAVGGFIPLLLMQKWLHKLSAATVCVSSSGMALCLWFSTIYQVCTHSYNDPQNFQQVNFPSLNSFTVIHDFFQPQNFIHLCNLAHSKQQQQQQKN